MKLLIVHNSLGLGGIETQLLQLLPLLKKYNINIDILLVRGIANDDIKKRFDEFTNIDCLNKWEGLPLLQSKTVPNNYDVIFCTGWRALLHGVRLKQRNRLRALVTFGVYHPREFCFQESPRYMNFLRSFLMRFPASNAAFLLREFADNHERFIGIDYSSSWIISLGIDMRRYMDFERRPNRKKIVCVARIVDFKTYLFHMADVVRALLDSGRDYEFHLYGYGEMESALKEKVASLNLESHYFIRNRIDYAKLPVVFRDAFMSIGEGASLIESSAAGVPSLLAIESNREPTSYGFFHEQSDLNVGSLDHSRSTAPIMADILRLADMASKDYLQASALSREKASKFSIDNVAGTFVDFLGQAQRDDVQLSEQEMLMDALESIKWTLMGKAGFKTSPGSRYMRDT